MNLMVQQLQILKHDGEEEKTNQISSIPEYEKRMMGKISKVKRS